MKKLTAVLLSVIMCVSLTSGIFAVDNSAPYQGKFYDVPNSHWAFTCIEEMSRRGVINGYPDGNYYPEGNVSRAEFAKIMCLAAGLNIKDGSGATSFADVTASDWYAPYIATGMYYLSGYYLNGQSYYYPNENALREDIAVALVKLKGYNTNVDESTLNAMFTDCQSISANARKYVAAALQNGLISGYDDHTFRGQASITRAEAATLLWRAYQYGNGNKVFDSGR